MIVTASVPAAIQTIHFRKFFSSSFLTSVHCNGLQQGEGYPDVVNEGLTFSGAISAPQTSVRFAMNLR
jgi:hypothetical protein